MGFHVVYRVLRLHSINCLLYALLQCVMRPIALMTDMQPQVAAAHLRCGRHVGRLH